MPTEMPLSAISNGSYQNHQRIKKVLLCVLEKLKETMNELKGKKYKLLVRA